MVKETFIIIGDDCPKCHELKILMAKRGLTATFRNGETDRHTKAILSMNEIKSVSIPALYHNGDFTFGVQAILVALERISKEEMGLDVG